jgi:hypothetical protein
VSDLWNIETNAWNADIINSTFYQQAASSIIQTPKTNSDNSDILCW